MGTNLIQKVPVMRYYYYSILKIKEIIFQPAHRFNIEVICGLVQKQNIRIAEKRLCEQHFHLPLGVKVGHENLVKFVRYVKLV